MTQKQYDDMTTIMQFSRLFASAMRKAMDNCGLTAKGFGLNVDVWDTVCEDGTVLKGAIRLQRGYESPKIDHSEDMTQLNYLEEGWLVANDPYAKAGSIPPEVHFEKRTVRQGMAEETGKPYPPDGLWVSSRDNPADVGGGQ